MKQPYLQHGLTNGTQGHSLVNDKGGILEGVRASVFPTITLGYLVKIQYILEAGHEKGLRGSGKREEGVLLGALKNIFQTNQYFLRPSNRGERTFVCVDACVCGCMWVFLSVWHVKIPSQIQQTLHHTRLKTLVRNYLQQNTFLRGCNTSNTLPPRSYAPEYTSIISLTAQNIPLQEYPLLKTGHCSCITCCKT